MSVASLERRSGAEAVASLHRGLHRHGLGGSIRLALALLARLVYLEEWHIWYRLDVGRTCSGIELPPGMEIIRAKDEDLALLAELPTVGLREARRRLAAGADPWLVRDAARAVFACWIFAKRMPVLAACGGWLALPRGMVGLEDSVTSPSYRGLGIAPAAWSAVASALATEGVGAILTKVEGANLPTRRAVEKAGFRAVAATRLRRVGGRSRVDVQLHGASDAAFLAARLAR
ncbi:MAG: GNAT family N-acetyltransferase [Candidatus Rokubacteria bacterium]|nr:GNAT family N-acetyltransferase [Candidatus Rokubacteria bacterium]